MKIIEHRYSSYRIGHFRIWETWKECDGFVWDMAYHVIAEDTTESLGPVVFGAVVNQELKPDTIKKVLEVLQPIPYCPE